MYAVCRFSSCLFNNLYVLSVDCSCIYNNLYVLSVHCVHVYTIICICCLYNLFMFILVSVYAGSILCSCSYTYVCVLSVDLSVHVYTGMYSWIGTVNMEKVTMTTDENELNLWPFIVQ